MKFNLHFFVFLMLGCSLSYAQISFEEHIVVNEANSIVTPNFVLLVDINGDGYNDVLYGNTHTISWFENLNGSGNMSPSYNIYFDLNSNIRQISTGDLDGDGDLDILFSESSNDVLFWLENINGQGDFSEEHFVISYNSLIADLRIKDINGDGKNDIIYIHYLEDSVVWLENLDDQSNFSSENIIAENRDFNNIDIADMDGDGDLDIVSSTSEFNFSSYSNLYWFENSDEQGSQWTEHLVENDLPYIGQLKTAALNIDDDYVDIIISCTNDFQIKWFSNASGNASFDESQIINNLIYTAKELEIIDINGDGKLDIVAATSTDISWQEQTSNGIFSESQFIANVSNNTRGKLAANFIDNDQDIDIITASDWASYISWYSNIDGQGTSWQRSNLPNRYAYAPTTVDIDGDGDRDFVAHTGSPNRLAIFKNQNGFGDFELSNTLAFPYDVEAKGFGDLDNDGDLDMFLAIEDNIGDKIIWLENDGNGNFSNEETITAIGNGSWSVSDVDGDGDLDLLTALPIYGFYWHENAPNTGPFANWSNHLIVDEEGSARRINAGDLDNDGDTDIITVKEYGMIFQGYIEWHENNGNEVFTDHFIENDLNSVGSIYLRDIDSDGDLDLLTYGSTSVDGSTGKVVWLENDGQGDFINENEILNTPCRSVKPVDFDLDNDIDLVCVDSNQVLFWLENTDGLGGYGDPQIINDSQSTKFSVSAVDLDGDLDIDIMLDYRYSDTILWLERNPALGIDEFDVVDFSIYPNPTNGFLIIDSEKLMSSITVYDQLGKVITIAKNSNTIDLSSISQGLYFVRIEGINGNTSIKKVIKQ